MAESKGVAWPELIARMEVLNAEATKVLPQFFPASPASAGASTDGLAAAEARLGHALDPLHAELLLAANGWPHTVLVDGTLFGTDELGQAELWNVAVEGIEIAYDEAAYGEPGDEWPPQEEIYVIAAFPFERHIVAIWRNGPLTNGGHPVLWFDGEITERWDNVAQWWAGMLTSRRRVIDGLLERSGGGVGWGEV